MIRSIYKKVLDKTLKRGYNIHMDRAVDKDTFLETIVEEYTFNKDTSKQTIDKLVQIGNQLKDSWDKHFPTKPLPVIAGGSVRDAVFGFKPADYDIFFNCKGVGEDWKNSTGMEDGAEMLIESFINEVFPHVDNDGACYQLGEKYKGVPDSLYVYETYYEPLTPYQFIGFENKDLPIDYIDTFDYGLVKIGYDLETEKFVVTEEFSKALKESHVLPRYIALASSREHDFLRKLFNTRFHLKRNPSPRFSEPKSYVDIEYENKEELLFTTKKVFVEATTAGNQLYKWIHHVENNENGRWAALPQQDMQQL